MSTEIDRANVLGAAQHASASLKGAIEIAKKRQGQLTANLVTAESALQANQTATDALTSAVPEQVAQQAASAIGKSAAALKSAGDLIDGASLGGGIGSALDEWKECRATIDRCDKLLVDLRKTGFGFVTAVVSVAAFVYAKNENFGAGVKSSLVCLLVLLIVMLYLVDLAHQTWLGQAVERAKILENDFLKFELTKNISNSSSASQAVILGVVLYSMLLVATCAIFWFSIPLQQEDLTSAPRARVYAAFALGQSAIIAAPLISSGRWKVFWILFGGVAAVTALLYGNGILRF